jgi:hypothetical protein
VDSKLIKRAGGWEKISDGQGSRQSQYQQPETKAGWVGGGGGGKENGTV